MDNVTINILELATELAHGRAMEEMIESGAITEGDGMWNLEQDPDEDGSGEWYVYTTEAQPIFDKWYDYFYTVIEELAN
jgi:hypothetical protein